MRLLRWFPLRAALFSLCALPAHFAWGDAPSTADRLVLPPGKSLFDPARHMRVSEVKPGMHGYGLTVFQGRKIERFNVEVVSILRHFSAKNDVVLIRCEGEFLNHTGSIAGMSGSPIYLTDSDGHDRMLGAFAYGWPLTKDPVAGVQPIEYMLQLPTAPSMILQAGIPSTQPTTMPAGSVSESVDSASPEARAAWSLKDVGMLPLAWKRGFEPIRGAPPLGATGELLGDGTTPRLEPLATPLMTSGLPARVLETWGPRFRAAGLTLLEAGGGGSSASGDNDAKLEPGSVLAVPLLTGDMEMTAIGTVTEVLGDRMWGFGHPFNNEGPISLPMGSGEINGVIANLQTSFKLGALTDARGSLNTDASVGVAGRIGQVPATVPIDITVQSADGSLPRAYHFNASRHAKFTPMIASAALAGAVTGTSELPQYNSVDYAMKITFVNGQAITLNNRVANVTSADLLGDAAIVMRTAAENPFAEVMVQKIEGSVTIRPGAEAAQILDVNLPKSHYHPGDKISAFVTYQPFHESPGILTVDMDLPRDLPHGEYGLIVSDAQRYVADEGQSKPFRFTAENIGDVFSVLKDVAGIRENAIYMRLVRRPDGVAMGHTAWPNLPSSRREILLASGRSDTVAFVSSNVKIWPTQWVMSGSAEFVIEVETSAKVLTGAPRGGKIEPAGPGHGDEKKSPPVSAIPGKSDAPKDKQPGE